MGKVCPVVWKGHPWIAPPRPDERCSASAGTAVRASRISSTNCSSQSFTAKLPPAASKMLRAMASPSRRCTCSIFDSERSQETEPSPEDTSLCDVATLSKASPPCCARSIFTIASPAAECNTNSCKWNNARRSRWGSNRTWQGAKFSEISGAEKIRRSRQRCRRARPGPNVTASVVRQTD